jgi:flagellar hook-basal body complex protein FliE
MDPISAMRLAGAGGAFPLDSMAGGAAAPAKIATQELQNLGSVGPAQMNGISQGLQGVQGVDGGRSFSDFLGEMVRDVNAKQAQAGDAVNGLLSGQNVPLHQAMISVEEANVSFQLMVEVRNKLLDSYQELMRMQV